MSKLLATVLAAFFAVVTVSPVAFAQTQDEKKAAETAAVDKACKGMKPGEEVTIEGKKVKCPAPKAATTK